MDYFGKLFYQHKHEVVEAMPEYERRLLLAAEPRLLARLGLDLHPATDLPASDKKQDKSNKRNTSEGEAIMNTWKDRTRTLLVDKVTDLALGEALPSPLVADAPSSALSSTFGTCIFFLAIGT